MNTKENLVTKAVIISQTENGTKISAASARISTTKGNALEIYEQSQDHSKNINLINKVLESGHRSFIEHHELNIAFNNVSAFVEQFLIEFRLASFTIKSRRYVDFSQMGYYIPLDISEELKSSYCNNMDILFHFYQEMLENNIPKEDARFILPYCYFSNFYCSCNVRELIHIICSMIYGRGKQFPELVNLGNQLKEQLEEIYPDIVSTEKDKYVLNFSYANDNINDYISLDEVEIGINKATVDLISSTPNGEELLLESLNLVNGGARINKLTKPYIEALLKDTRGRNLELLNFTFKISNISLAGLTHLVRHRMQSIIVPGLLNVPFNKKCVLPSSIKNNSYICKKYLKLISENVKQINRMLKSGMPVNDIIYFNLSGNLVDVITNMNARELLVFIRLRSCNRAQWEIREVSDNMLLLLKEYSRDIFSSFGPSCEVFGTCPEGKLTCGRLNSSSEQ